MAINLMNEAQDKIVKRFKLASVTEGIFSNDYTWNGVKAIDVYTLDAITLGTYDRTEVTSSRFGTMVELGDTKQTLTITQEKGFEVSVDAGNDIQQKHIKKAAEITRSVIDDSYIPLVDTYRLSVLATGAGTKKTSQPALTAANIVEKIMLGRAELGNNKVPMGNDVVFIGETDAVYLKIADQVVGIDTVGAKPIVNGVIGKIGGCQVRVVPDSYMPTGISFMIVHKGCAWAPEQLRTLRVLNEHPFVDGIVVQGHFIYDCFVNTTLNKGIYTYAT
jgi:hypothetical protein